MAKEGKRNKGNRGDNSKRASAILKANKKEYQKIFKEEVQREKNSTTGGMFKPSMTDAAKNASKRYRKIKLTWQQALKQANK